MDLAIALSEVASLSLKKPGKSGLRAAAFLGAAFLAEAFLAAGLATLRADLAAFFTDFTAFTAFLALLAFLVAMAFPFSVPDSRADAHFRLVS